MPNQDYFFYSLTVDKDEFCKFLGCNEIFIDVIDSGPGVPSSMTRAIFEPFFRVEQSRMVDSNSFGLGLALAKRQIETVGGEISASNRSPNGLKVTIRLPIQA